MNNGIPESIELANRLVDSLEEIPDVNKVICPPHIALSEVKNVVTGTTVKLGAQHALRREWPIYWRDISEYVGRNL